MTLNPDFTTYKRLTDLVAPEGEEELNFESRAFQRPVGYSAMTRLHVGRLCVPMRNDSGATCSCLTEEQVVLILNHTFRMVQLGKLQLSDYNYPIRTLYRYQHPAVLRGAEKQECCQSNLRLCFDVSSFLKAVTEVLLRIFISRSSNLARKKGEGAECG